jgi:phosphoribosyl-AMP cyclohydrolase
MWKKGETSGETLKVMEILTDCDQDILQVKAEPQGRGASCHTGRRSCFYRRVEGGRLVFTNNTRLFDPGQVY